MLFRSQLAGGPPFGSAFHSKIAGALSFDSAQGRLLRSLQGRERCCLYHKLSAGSKPVLHAVSHPPFRFAFFLSVANCGCPILSRSVETVGAGMLDQLCLCRVVTKRNLGPADVHPDWTGFLKKIEPVAAPAPLFGRLRRYSSKRNQLGHPTVNHCSAHGTWGHA